MAKIKVEDEEEDFWDVAHEVSILCQWDEVAVRNTINLFDQDNTIPFIARYRQEVTKGMGPEKLREVHDKYEEFKTVKEKVVKILQAPKNQDKITPKMKQDLKWAKSLTEVDHISAPLKSGSKRALAERARELGLEDLAMDILKKPHTVRQEFICKAINKSKEGLQSKEEVQKGVQHIIADVIAKDKHTFDQVRYLSGLERERFGDIIIEVSAAKKSDAAGAKKTSAKEKKIKVENDNKPKRAVDADKFADYIDRKFYINNVKPHQVLAINRGENLKVLSVKFTLSDREKNNFQNYLGREWIGRYNGEWSKTLQESIDDGFKRLVEPLILRQARSELNKRAEKASIDVFAANLKRLLLTPPVKGQVVLGVDPGFAHGCKFAVTSATGEVLDVGVAYLHGNRANQNEAEKIRKTIVKNRCDTVAIGNGTACRETESFFSKCIADKYFKPLDVKYCIVDESGASIYSASPEATQELPQYDITIRGAVSIARRLQDPLAELVKIEPKHIGVGMYQHDCSEAKLKSSLESVVMECVSFTGADLNSSSQTLLRKIAGLDKVTAERIVKYREETGPFSNRQQLLSIKGLGAKKFQQCAGFVRILPMTRGKNQSVEENKESTEIPKLTGSKRKAASKDSGKLSKKAKLNKNCEINELDMTAIHPETYEAADNLIQDAGLAKKDIGTKTFIEQFTSYSNKNSIDSLAKRHKRDEPTMIFIVSSLKQPIEWDIREEFKKPLFRREVMKFTDLKPGVCLTGKVQNCVHFGVFVDVGVGQSGLLHNSKIRPNLLKNGKALGVGDIIEVEVDRIDEKKRQLGLVLKQVL